MTQSQSSPLANILWSTGSSLASAAIDIAKLAVMTVYLSPGELGLYAILSVVLGFSQLFSEGGLANAIVSRERLNSPLLGQLFNLNLLLGLAIMLVAMAFAPVVANFYAMTELTLLIPLILLGIPFSAINRFYQATLQQHLMMRLIGSGIVIAKAIGLVATILLCIWGFGIYALVGASLITTLALCAIFATKASEHISYQRGLAWSQVKPFASFSAIQLGDQLLNFFSKNFDILLITKLLGTETAGLYHVSKSLLMRAGEVIVQSLSRYFHPLLANHRIHQPEDFDTTYLKFFRSVTFVNVLAYTLLAINHGWIIQLIFGPAFQQIGPLFVAMCLWLGLRFSTAPVATLWLVKQKPQYGLYWNSFIALILPALIYTSAAGGNIGIVQTLSVAQALILVLAIAISISLCDKRGSATLHQGAWLGLMLAASAVSLWLGFAIKNPTSTLAFSIAVVSISIIIAYRTRNRLFLS